MPTPSIALAWLRAHTSTLTREQLYGFAVLLIGGSGVVNGVDGRIETALVSVVTSTLVLLLAAINSRPVVASVYVLLGAVAGLGQIVAVVYTGLGWASWVGYAAGLLGTAAAFFRVQSTPPARGGVVPPGPIVTISDEQIRAAGQAAVEAMNAASVHVADAAESLDEANRTVAGARHRLTR